MKPDGEPSAEHNSFKYAMSLLQHLFGGLPAVDFGPKSLKALREAMIRPMQWTDPVPGPTGKCKHHVHSAWSRKHANHQIGRVKHIFKWATAEELIPPSIYHGLLSVDGLRRGRSEARETEPVRPAPPAMVAQVLEFLPSPVRAMVELEAITGARGGELCIMRGCDIDTSNADCWVYRPTAHKTAHHGHERRVPFGKRCQEIIKPFLKANPQSFLFSTGRVGNPTPRRDAQGPARIWNAYRSDTGIGRGRTQEQEPQAWPARREVRPGKRMPVRSCAQLRDCVSRRRPSWCKDRCKTGPNRSRQRE